MALEASDRLIDIMWVNWRCICGCISRPTFKLSAWHNGRIKRNQPRPQKIVDLHKSGSTLGAVHKPLKVPRSSVQTIVRKYKHHGTTQPSYRSGRRRALSPRDFGANQSQNNSKGPCEDAGGDRYKTISAVKRVLYQHNLKGRSARKKPLLQNRHKKIQTTVCNCTLFGEMSSRLTKQK